MVSDARITIISGRCTVTTPDGQSIASPSDVERFNAAVEQGRLLRFRYGGVIWYEPVTASNMHMLRVISPKPPKDQSHVERRGRPRGPSYGKHVKNPGAGRGGHNRHEIPLNIVVALKERGLSGSEIARELFDLGYGEVSRDYANRRLREAGYTPELQQRGGRPRKTGE